MQNSKHYFRAGALVIGGLFLFLLVRSFLVPSSFGKYGPYRGDNVREQMAKPTSYSAPNACADCHPDVWKKHSAGKHAPLPCQDCHAPLSQHFDLEKGELIGPMPIQKTSKLCLRCHLKLPSRPASFPQINPEDHLIRVPEARQADVCFRCHNPHSPALRKKNVEAVPVGEIPQ
ncbi:MAG: hypothetical protein Q7T03_02820 [Deltaproteobacteria bacterium]|nr:hypothetical protein [Deltaproteobacteria bacterium]